MNRRFFALFCAFLFACVSLTPAFAAPKKHAAARQIEPRQKESRQKSAHLARLAAQQKAAWREHLAKVRELPRAERLALKRHDRRLAKQQEAAVVKPKKTARIVKSPVKAAKASRQTRSSHPQKAADSQKEHPRKVAAAQESHAANLAAQQKSHREKLAAGQATHRRNLAEHDLRLARQQAAHAAKASQMTAAHNARLASKRAKQVALHGDGSGGRSIKFWQTVAASVPVKVITVDLNDDNVKVSAVMARRGNGTAEPFRQMIDRANPNVAVTGTFFSLDNLRPVGDIVIDGSLVHFGGMGTALCVTPSNRASMVTVEWGRHRDWGDYDFVCACGPRLLRRGRVVLDPHAEKFKDKHMLAPNSRIAVGITPGNKLVFAMTRKPIYLGRLAKVMRALGVSEAMNLDAGTSTGFYYNGATLAKPGRSLTNMIVVYGRKDRYERALGQLVPAPYRRASR